MNDQDTNDSGEFTRYRANVQLGDGPDCRGDITVEVVRDVRPDREHVETTFADPATPDGARTVMVEQNGEEFGEFALELQRSTALLRDTLGLPKRGL